MTFEPLTSPRLLLIVLPALLPLGGCAGASAATVTVYAAAGSRQCEAPPPEPQAAAVARLVAAGLEPRSPRCGHDGRMRAAMCGLADGRIVVVDLPASALDAARNLGWKPLSELPDARVQACE
ncbi:hypothetical protein CLD22_09400 [Rubrivivax gelatinosus]|nr:hypothetical protein [Rubrivivax gelatinosus]